LIKARFGADVDQVIHRLFPWVARLRVRPDTLTLLGVALAAGSGIAFATGRPGTGGLLMLGAGLCDLVDGVVARAQGNSSPSGAFLDSSMDRVADLLILSGITVHFAALADPRGAALACWALGASVMTSYTRARAEVELRELRVGVMERGERFVVLIAGALLGFLQLALAVVAVGGTITTIQRMVVARRRLGALETPADAAAEREPRRASGS
jgi:CDP-diacylglycerol--glycerol-3-phosphate 3-phosphatidyltransferase